jgi:hypothetical protein
MRLELVQKLEKPQPVSKHRLRINPFGGQTTQCPRCGLWAVENLLVHAHCWECNYFPDEYADILSVSETNQEERKYD